MGFQLIASRLPARTVLNNVILFHCQTSKKMSVSTAIQATIVLQLLSKAVCQFPYPLPPGARAFPPNMAPMGPMGPMAPMGPMPPQQAFMPPMPFQMQQKMPSVVMPYYSRSANPKRRPHRPKHSKKKRRKPRRYESSSWESDNDSSDSSSSEFDFRRSNKRRQVLTPVVSYVTKDGYVIYQKKIKKDKAKDWLEMAKRSQEMRDGEEEQLMKKLMKLKRRRRYG